VPELALAKRHAAAFVDGQPGAWTLMVRNDGTAPTTGATTVVDTLPNGIGFVSGLGSGWTFAALGPVVTASSAGVIAPQYSAVMASGTTVTDVPPAGLTFVSASGPGFTFLTSGQVVTGTDPDSLAPGDSLTLTLTVSVDASAYPQVTNTATVASPGDVNPADD